jgi:REP element-mobilizing transposase RayT
MKFNPDIHHRRSIRLRHYDYSQAGAYFVTVCTQNRECMFGKIVDRTMVLSDAGKMIQMVWDKLSIHYDGVDVDQFIVMPNHVHGILVLVGAGPRACPDTIYVKTGQPQGVAPTISLSDVMHRFKTFTTTQYRLGVNQYQWSPFPGKLWQRNYYEHIIRAEEDLNKIREYIVNNPAGWDKDEENPNKIMCDK